MKLRIIVSSCIIIISTLRTSHAEDTLPVRDPHTFDVFHGSPYLLYYIGDSHLFFAVGDKSRKVVGTTTVVVPPSSPEINYGDNAVYRAYTGRVTGKIVNTMNYFRAHIIMRSSEGDVINGIFESSLNRAPSVSGVWRFRLHSRFHGTISDPALLGITKTRFTMKRTQILPASSLPPR